MVAGHFLLQKQRMQKNIKEKVNLVQSQRPRVRTATRCATCSAGWGGTSRVIVMQPDATRLELGTSGSACHIQTSVDRKWLYAKIQDTSSIMLFITFYL